MTYEQKYLIKAAVQIITIIFIFIYDNYYKKLKITYVPIQRKIILE